MLSKGQIFAAQDGKVERVEVPEWGGHVFVKTMSAGDRDQWEASILDARGKFTPDHGRAKLLLACVCDEAGKPLFDRGDVHDLSKKSSVAVQRVFDAAAKLNGIGKNDVDELEKNSGQIHAGPSSSD